ncbi:MAPEG family protein [Mesorhizobium sp. M0488]|uniref:MAPEG family protein n=1 Tax=unclassified Mesorhizobium TaxID=325217 RepID=UPI00333A2038
MEAYWLSILGVLAICLLSVVLAIYSGSSKGFAGALAGPVVPADDGNRLYRIDRVHMNSVEALAPFVVPAMLAMMVGVGAATLATLVWVHMVIRLLHLGIYLRGGNAARGGSVRTILYVSGALVTFALLLVTAWAALN